MSHNVNLAGVKITDMAVLGQAVKELAKETKVDMKLVKNGVMRGYYGDTSNADYVLQMPSCRYDVGFNKQKDGSYVPVCEDTARHDFGQILGPRPGEKTVSGQSCDLTAPETMIGRLTQRVNVIAAENEAARSGMTTMREVDKKTGIINVVCTSL